VATPRWFNEVRAAQARIRAAAGRLTVPTLMQVVGQDRIVSTEVSLAFAAESKAIEVRRYEGLYHELFLEPERDRVIADLRDWVVARARPARIIGAAP
jgi:alpha-beta hydrolase superfamily lysophospholipase